VKFEPLTAMRAIAESRLGPIEKAVAHAYVLHANSDGIAWPGAERIGSYVSRHERTVRKVRDTLVRIGVLIERGTCRRAPKYKINPDAAVRYMPDDSQLTLGIRASDPDTGNRARGPHDPGPRPALTGPAARLTAHELLMNCSQETAGELPTLSREEKAEAVIDVWLLLHERRREGRQWGTKSGKPPGYPRGRPSTVPSQVRTVVKRADSLLDIVLVMRWAFESPDFDCKALRGELRRGDRVRLDLASLLRHREGTFERRLALAQQWAEEGAKITTRAGEYTGPKVEIDEDEERETLADLRERARSGDAF
jgi:hypothetical protein